MKRFLLTFLTLTILVPTLAAEGKKFDYKFYGFIRGDFYYNDRASVASVNEVFYLYPKDVDLDENGDDLNERSTSGFYSFVTRLGLDGKGPNIGSAATSAKVEVDFGGYGNFNTLLRIRQAYFNMDWQSGNSLLVGQTWHPLFGSVMPSIANLSTGSPFQPFNRSPMLRYQYASKSGLKLTAAAIYQLQYTSSGENGSSNEYVVNGCIPEFYVGVDYTKGGLLIGGGVDMLNLTPRTQSTTDDGKTYKVDEHLTSFSAELHLKYTKEKFSIAAKSIFASALDHTLLLGGYAITSIDEETRESEYTPIRNSTSWINISYGQKWIPYIFVGYTKNLGTSESLVSSTLYGRGTDIDQLLGANCGVKYARPHWSMALEYSRTTAWYGDLNLSSGRIENTHSVCNNRIVGIVSYYF